MITARGMVRKPTVSAHIGTLRVRKHLHPSRPKGVFAVISALVFAFSSMNSPASGVTYARGVVDGTKLPWVVTLWSKTEPAGPNRQQCTGVLIASQWVLTAAHCIEGMLKPFEVRAGGKTSSTGKSYEVDGYLSHPQYREGLFTNDIGIVHLKTPVSSKTYAALPPSDASKLFREFGEKLELYGFGRDERGLTDGKLRWASQRDISSKGKSVLGPSFDERTMIAAGRYESSKKVYSGACRGDSGGPLATPNRSRPVVVGIVSFGAELCSSKSPTVYTRVSAYRTWLTAAQQSIINIIAEREVNTGKPSTVDVTIVGRPSAMIVSVTGIAPDSKITLRCVSSGKVVTVDLGGGSTLIGNVQPGNYLCSGRPAGTTNIWSKIGSVSVT
jgi:secreted trypsin-like serine protease